MDFKIKFSEGIGMDDIKEILRLTHESDHKKQEIYDLIIGEDEQVGYIAAWVFTHFSTQDNKWLYDKRNELIDELLVCKHGGKRRLILNLLYKQPLINPIRVDLLDFCLEKMISIEELPGVRSLCIKIAYELCIPYPELIKELKTTLEMMEGYLSPAILSARHKVLKNIQHKKNT